MRLAGAIRWRTISWVTPRSRLLYGDGRYHVNSSRLMMPAMNFALQCPFSNALLALQRTLPISQFKRHYISGFGARFQFRCIVSIIISLVFLVNLRSIGSTSRQRIAIDRADPSVVNSLKLNRGESSRPMRRWRVASGPSLLCDEQSPATRSAIIVVCASLHALRAMIVCIYHTFRHAWMIHRRPASLRSRR